MAALTEATMDRIERSSRVRMLRLTLWGLVAASVAGLAWLSFSGGRKVAPDMAASPAQSRYASAFGGAFTMSDPGGRTITNETLKGKPFAIFFGFTRCPDVCPTTLNRMAALRRELGSDGEKFNIVFVTVDPDHDKPAALAQYLGLFHTPIIGLRGSDAQLAAIVKAYHVIYLKIPTSDGDYTIDHTATVYLMGRQGEFVSAIDHAEDQASALAKLRRLIATR